MAAASARATTPLLAHTDTSLQQYSPQVLAKTSPARRESVVKAGPRGSLTMRPVTVATSGARRKSSLYEPPPEEPPVLELHAPAPLADTFFGTKFNGSKSPKSKMKRFNLPTIPSTRVQALVSPPPMASSGGRPVTGSQRFMRERTALAEARLRKATAGSNQGPGYMLVGQRVTPKNKGDIDEAELIRLERLQLSPAPELYFGRGLMSEQLPIRSREWQRTQSRGRAGHADSLIRASSSAPGPRPAAEGDDSLDDADSLSRSRSSPNASGRRVHLAPGVQVHGLSTSTLSLLSDKSATSPTHALSPPRRVAPLNGAAGGTALSSPAEMSIGRIGGPAVGPAGSAQAAFENSLRRGSEPRRMSEQRERGSSDSMERPAAVPAHLPIPPRISRRASSVSVLSVDSEPQRRQSYNDFVADFEREPDEEEVRTYQIRELYNVVGGKQQDAFTEKFKEIDKDNDGLITMDEMHQAVAAHSEPEEFRNMCKLLRVSPKDSPHPDMVGLRDFICVATLNDRLAGRKTRHKDYITQFNVPLLEENIRMYKSMFYLADQEQTGVISMESLRLLLTAAFGVEIGLDDQLAQIIMQTVDKDASGSIDFVEFMSYIPFFIRLHQQICQNPVVTDPRDSVSEGPSLVNVVTKAKADMARTIAAPTQSSSAAAAAAAGASLSLHAPGGAAVAAGSATSQLSAVPE